MSQSSATPEKPIALTRIGIQALALMVVIPTLLIVYMFRNSLDIWSLPVMFFLLMVALLGFMLVWRVLRGISSIMAGLQKVSSGETQTLVVSEQSGQLKEMAEIVNALNRLTEEFRENAAQLERFIQQFATLAELTEITAQIPNINELLRLVLRRTMASTHARIGVVMLLSEEGRALEIVAAEGWTPKNSGQILLDDKHGRKVIETGVPMLLEGIGNSPFADDLGGTERYDASSVLVMPLKAKNSTVGLLSLADKATGGAFESQDQQFLTVLLGQMGYAVENARLLKQARSAAVNLRKTVEIQETQLQEAQQKMIQTEKLSALGQLAGGVAHDFNNLLQAILGYSKLTMKSPGSEASRVHDIEMIQKAAERAAALTRKLLAFGRRQVLNPTNLDINRGIDDVVEMIKRIIGEHVHLEIIRGSKRIVHADAQQIEQVLVNLCVNARDAMPNGGTVTVETSDVEVRESLGGDHPGVEPGHYVLLSVKDEGCGMDEETVKHIFEPFFTTKEVGKGTGLGLSTVYGIVRQHNGTVNVTSEPGKGTTFRIHLPAVDCPADANLPDKMERATSGGNETILVVEDEEIVRDLTVRILEEAGYKVLSASNGEKAIKMFENHRDEISLVLLDAVLPRISGWDVCDQMISIDHDVRVLFSSGYRSHAFHTEFLRDRGFQVIQKPHTPNELLRKVREVLDGAKLATAHKD